MLEGVQGEQQGEKEWVENKKKECTVEDGEK